MAVQAGRGDPFPVIMVSSSDLETYPNNTSSHFRNHLTLIENLRGNWFVCLEKINYEKSFNGEGLKEEYEPIEHPLLKRRPNLSQITEEISKWDDPFFLIRPDFGENVSPTIAWKVIIPMDNPVWNTPHPKEHFQALVDLLNKSAWLTCDENGNTDVHQGTPANPENNQIVRANSDTYKNKYPASSSQQLIERNGTEI